MSSHEYTWETLFHFSAKRQIDPDGGSGAGREDASTESWSFVRRPDLFGVERARFGKGSNERRNIEG